MHISCTEEETMVMPLFKKGDANTPSNYRPISRLSCLGKLMERVVYKHLYNHFVSQNLLYCKQSGFLRGHSTVFQLIDIFDRLARSLDDKTVTCMFFVIFPRHLIAYGIKASYSK